MKLTEESSTRKMRTVVSFLTGFSFEDVGIKNMKSKKEKRTKKHIFGKIIL